MSTSTTGENRSQLGYVWYQLKQSPLLIVGIVIVTLILAMALLAPWLAHYDPYQVDLKSRLLPPNWQHWAGTDEVGRDLLSRILFGTRASLMVAFGLVSIALVFGTILGALSALLGGKFDLITMRLVEVVMAMPGLVVALALTAALGPSLFNMSIALGCLGIPYYARLSRSQALSLAQRQYVAAARTMGASTYYILRRHMLKNLLSYILVYASMHLSGAILAGSALSFIGLGAQPPTAELGALINTGRGYIIEAWWYPVFPGVVLVLASLSFNLLGDGLRDLFDPKATKR